MVEGNFPVTSIISSFLFSNLFLFFSFSISFRFNFRFISSSYNDVKSQRNPYRSNHRIDRISGILSDVETDDRSYRRIHVQRT